jgi:Zn-dependent peptidase ImmA (M78 family)
MEKKMTNAHLHIKADWETLNEGAPEERACFAAISINWGETCLTECHDPFVNRIRSSPLLSGYHLAEWLAWNWWRLRWEPRTPASDWPFAHNMATIGAGYVWPNITIFSDGQRIALIAKPTQEVSTAAFRFISNVDAIVQSRQFETSIDAFIEQIINQLREERISDTNLHKIWFDMQNERNDIDLAKRRKFEALLGVDPDEGNISIIDRLINDAQSIGDEEAMGEVAANHPGGGSMLTVAEIRDAANKIGFDISLQNSVSFDKGIQLPGKTEVPAWLLGAIAAKELRKQEHLEDSLIDDATLAGLAGVQESIINSSDSSPDLSFILHEGRSSRIAFRSKWRSGRRFELARLLGDRLVTASDKVLFPATRAYTFRQKMQRSFAAEFLAPFEAVKERLDGDYSEEKRHEVSLQFEVSDRTIDTILVNHRLLERDDLVEDFDAMDACNAA